MKSDFTAIKQQLSGIVRVVSGFYQIPQRKGSVFFVKSPATHDKTHSLAIYPDSNRFTDFANGNYSGDCISFVAYVRGCNNWQALKELQAYYGLRRRILLQQEQERQKEERKKQFRQALYGCISSLFIIQL